MKPINDLLKKYDLTPNKYRKNGKVFVVSTKQGNFVVKQRSKDQEEIYNYLNSRSFYYYPKILNQNEDDYQITEYVEEVEMPREQKITDLIDLLSLLHNKTTYYKEVEEDYYKKIYEDILGNIEHLSGYYKDMMEIIDKEIYMRPSYYLLARNSSLIFGTLNYTKKEIDEWYKMVEKKNKVRLAVLHNNLNLDHFMKNRDPYFISWDKAKIENPIFDLYKLYKNHALDFDFSYILKRYEKSYPLLPDERKLLFVLLALPPKFLFDKGEFHTCEEMSAGIDLLYKTERLISSYTEEK